MILAAAVVIPVSVNAAEAEISQSDRDILSNSIQQMIEQITAMTDEQMDSILAPSSILAAQDKFTSTSVESWKNAKETLGAYKSIKDTQVEVSDHDGIIVTTKAVCENGEGNVVLTISREDMTPVSLAFDANTDTTIGAKMKTAALNTLIGLVVVFAMLFFLSGIISLFKHFNKIGAKKNNSETNSLEAERASVVVPQQEIEEEELIDDGELVAVIAAAIAASENTSADGFVVRSIRKANKSKWQRA